MRQILHHVKRRQAMYVQRNNKAHSCNHYCSRKAIRLTYSECVCSLSFPAWNTIAVNCHLWPVRLNGIFPHLINGTVF